MLYNTSHFNLGLCRQCYLLVLIILFAPLTKAQSTINFSDSGLQGENLNNPTSLDFAPDGRLYVSQQNGTIYAYSISRIAPNNYVVTNTETINLVKNITNHNDDTGNTSGTNNRQITGILSSGTSANPKLFVTSSDPRIGAGGGGVDKNLDTNSGIVSCLTCVGGMQNDQCQAWEKIDLVRGLPRSEENHASNGMQLDEVNNILYVTSGGHTNAGAPSNNFAFTTEYALSAAILTVDLSYINGLSTKTDNDGSKYKYDLPTLDDPTRDNINGINDPSLPGYNGIDPGDPFGGNDGLNQAKWDPNGPVQVYSPGYRNLYDIVITEKGRMYGVDNGANGGWGGHNAGEADYGINGEVKPGETHPTTNDFIVDEPGSGGAGPGGDSKVNNKNGLHYIRELQPGDFNYVKPGEPYYAGHPTPVRANPAGAGLYTKGPHTVDPNDGDDQYWRNEILAVDNPNFSTQSLPVDWPPVPVSLAYAAEGDFRNSGQDDNSIANYGPSTNGIAEYTASNFGGAIQGNLLLAGFNGNIYEVLLNEAGDKVLNCPTPPENGSSTLGNCNASFASGFGSKPLDVIAQGDDEPFGGTVWAATYGSNNITIFEPADYDGNDPTACSAANEDNIDEDGDFYTNADEIANGTNPCSGASQPEDNDGVFEFGAANQFKRSNLLDNDDDHDGILDNQDAFAIDAENGTGNIGQLPIRLDLFNSTGYGFGDIGYTGLMANGEDDYLSLIDDSGDELVFGGTAGIYTDPSVSSGDAYQSNNNQKNGFQFGVDVNTSTGPFTVLGQINGPFFNGQPPLDFASQGIYIGTGDQDNYVKATIRNGGGASIFEIVTEIDGVPSSKKFPTANILDKQGIVIFFDINPSTGLVQVSFSADNGTRTLLGDPIQLSGDLLSVVQGNYTISGKPSALAVGTLATSAGNAPEFAASWDYFEVTQNPSDYKAFVEVNTGGINSSTFGGGFKIENTSEGGFNISSVTLDLSTAIIPEVVFDPDGNAGDGTAKGFAPTNNSQNTTGVSGHNFSDAYEGGFYKLTIDFDGFEPGENLTFGVDIDPISIKGGSSPGPNQSGSVSGLELAGSKVLVTFDNGETIPVELYRTQPNSVGAANNVVRTQLPAKPGIEVLSVSNKSTVFQADQVVRISGPVGASVQLLHVEAGLFVKDLTGPYAGVGYDIDPFEVNSVVAIDELDGTIGTDGITEFNVSLLNSDIEAGYNIFAAVLVDGQDNATGDLSDLIIVKYDPSAAPSTLLKINAGGSEYIDGNGEIWAEDVFFSGGNQYTNNTPDIVNTTDDILYHSERSGPNGWSYIIPLANGLYTINLHFAEIFFGVQGGNLGNGGTGKRVFDVEIEGQKLIQNLDLNAEATPPTAIIKTFNVNVLDGELTIVGSATVNQPKISAIEILAFDGVPPPPTEIPIVVQNIANQVSQEGTAPDLAVAASGGDGNLTYAATGLPTGLSIEPTNGQIINTISPGAANGSPYNVIIAVDDSDDNTTDAKTINFTWTVTGPDINPEPDPNATALYRVNVGGPETPAADASLPNWSADVNGNPSPYFISGSNNFYSGNSGSAHPGEIVYTDPSLASVPAALATIFNTERWDQQALPEMVWQFAVTPGIQIQVNLLFAELFGQVNQAGQRVFDVSVEGSVPPVFDDIDPYAMAGPKGAFIRSYQLTVLDDILEIVCIHGIENPALKGIEIVAVGSATQGSLTGNFSVQGRENYALDLSVKFYETGTLNQVYEFTPTANEAGTFLLPDLAPGTYDIALKHSQSLQIVQATTIVTGANTVDFGELKMGDADNDNSVTDLDLIILQAAYNLAQGNENYDGRADFNGDGTINALDFSLLSTNYNQSGQELNNAE